MVLSQTFQEYKSLQMLLKTCMPHGPMSLNINMYLKQFRLNSNRQTHEHRQNQKTHAEKEKEKKRKKIVILIFVFRDYDSKVLARIYLCTRLRGEALECLICYFNDFAGWF